MQIGIDISQIAYPKSGVSNYTRQLVTNLIRMNQDDYYVLFGSSLRRMEILREFYSNNVGNGSREQAKYYQLPLRFLEILWNQIHLIDIERFTGTLDVFHSSDWVEPPAKARKVTTIHDLLVYKFPQFMHPAIVNNQRRKLEWVKRECALVIADSENTKHDIVKYLNVKEEKIRVIYLGVDDHFKPQTPAVIQSIRKKYRIDKDYFLVVGLEPRKNVPRILESFALLHRDDVELVVVGQQNWGERIPVRGNVRIVGQVDTSDLVALYSGSLALVYPSLYEGFGLPVLDCMVSGSCVIVSDRGSLKEIAGEAAIIVVPEDIGSIADGMNQILDESIEERSQRIEVGKSWARQFKWEKTARQTLAVYHEVVS